MEWILTATEKPPNWFIELVQQYATAAGGNFAAQLFWQRGIKEPEKLAAFINYQTYQPADAFAFGEEINLAVERLIKTGKTGEKIAIWGDFDADGITSTAVLWDGLGEFFPQHRQLSYYIPNRLTESHGLNKPGIDNLAAEGCKLIVTCDTGSTNITEIIYAQSLGIDIIVTDHHTLPPERPPVVAIINPRYLPKEHPLYHLSGVAVAYKLVEALYISLPDIPEHPLTNLLDLVAVGLIADLVQLSGDCRYLAQLGIQQLHTDFKKLPTARRRPGVGKLLELCQKSGDRPTDISFGLGPRINAVSRIHGDASFCVELLTSRDMQRCQQLAEETELANSRRKSLQKDVQNQVNKKLSQLDLSTTSVIVLEDPQWAVGVLGLVAGQIAQETGRPTILLSTEVKENGTDYSPSLARGSARSINSVDLYQLVQEQAHLLHRFGGHPFAAGLSLLVENIPLFTAAINQKLRQSLGGVNLTPTVQADLVVTVADLGKDLFLELKLLEPCGMGNPIPKLLIKNCWFENTWHRKPEDLKGKQIQYIKTDFDIRDDSTENPFPGIWWGHYKEELPLGRCDCIAEIDFNSFKKRYEIRLIAVRPNVEFELETHNSAVILDWRNEQSITEITDKKSLLIMKNCPTNWDDLQFWYKKAVSHQQQLVIAWKQPQQQPISNIWLTLVGIAKYLSRTHKPVTRVQLLEKLGISDQSLYLGFQGLKCLGFIIQRQENNLQIIWDSTYDQKTADHSINQFLAAVREEQFQRDYFFHVPLSMIVSMMRK
ncbi:single-stranded-DNA-specific exonuclease RecJ [Cuspidothrix issatschenkoi]|uniref:Single-stranded-DNA-specific exonuclease RecJ n=1 Tax=Cuspidothrix issatschenkoi CHARLIE-1 TaxID=2052836 RepID=A0A2S6CYM0_9CYAN|nr:single-stranded-DNA-specific exonuclease RecJ [Cuspidothrix issatschenkoi]PPJ64809.1 single-stranded-DNA-specific exonuclease RecJ [Cuspidothrix issatschenkoi CHARLIE-1]